MPLIPFLKDLGLWSDLIDMLAWYKQQRANESQLGGYGKCLPVGHNTGIYDMLPGEIAYVNGALQPSADTPAIENMKYSPILELETPVWHSKIDKVVLLHKGILTGEVNPCTGPTILPALGTVVNANDKYVMVDPAFPSKLKTSDAGIFGLIGSLEYGGETALIVDTTVNQPLWRYQLTSYFVGGLATAELLRLDGAVYGSITLTEAGGFMFYADSSAAGYCMQVGNKFIPIPGPEAKVFIAPIGGVPARTGTGPWTAGTAACLLASTVGSSITATAEASFVNNVATSSIPAGSLFVASPINGSWYTGGAGGSDTDPIQRLSCLLGTRSGGSSFHAADPRTANAIINTGSVVRLSSDPFNEAILSGDEVPNPMNLTGKTGDFAILEFNWTTGTYFLSQVIPATQRQLWVKVATDRPNGLAVNISCHPDQPIDGGNMPSDPFNVKDLFNVAFNAKEDHRGLAQYEIEAGEYRMIVCEHIATRVKGEIYADADDTPDDVQVTNLQGLNGITPGGAPLTVLNRFKQTYFKVNDVVEFHWDGITGEWYIIQSSPPYDFPPVYVL